MGKKEERTPKAMKSPEIARAPKKTKAKLTPPPPKTELVSNAHAVEICAMLVEGKTIKQIIKAFPACRATHVRNAIRQARKGRS